MFQLPPLSPVPPYTVTGSNHRQLLDELFAQVRRGEDETQALLRAFDRDLYGSAQDNINLNAEVETATESPWPSPPHEAEKQNAAHRNSYASTPLRLKYFPNLSPSTLQLLLKSPSLRVSTPDENSVADVSLNSFSGDDNSRYEAPSIDLGTRPLEQFSPADPGEHSSLPPFEDRFLIEWLFNTPRATPRLCVQKFGPYLKGESKDGNSFTSALKRLTRLEGDHLVLRNAPPESTSTAFPLASPIILGSDDFHWKSTLADRSFLSNAAYISRRPLVPISPNKLRTSPPLNRRYTSSRLHSTYQASSLVSPSNFAKYELVMHQLMGAESTEAQEAESILLDKIPTLPKEHPIISDATTHNTNGQRQTGSLDMEFSRLLEEKAADEEMQATELMDLAVRLQMLAAARRTLAEVVNK